tara:strand:- start:9056 stop:9619 length:564 start_codon:yes stop_codon:yes gene_type:complete
MALFNKRFSQSGSAQNVSVEVLGLKEIEQMFQQLPKQVSQKATWTKFWRDASKPLVKSAQNEAPVADKDIPYPPKPALTIKRETLKKSIGFFTTKASRENYGGYVGPRVKGRFKKEKGGYFGAWIEYGNQVEFFGKYTGRAQTYMADAWETSHRSVMMGGMKSAEKIFTRAVKIHERRLKKYGTLGY